MFPFFRRRAFRPDLFNDSYLDSRALFVQCFDALPSVGYLQGIDVNAALVWISTQWAAEAVQSLQHARFNPDTDGLEFNVHYLVLRRPCIVEIGTDYVALFYTGADRDWVTQQLRQLAVFRIAAPAPASGRIGFATAGASCN